MFDNSSILVGQGNYYTKYIFNNESHQWKNFWTTPFNYLSRTGEEMSYPGTKDKSYREASFWYISTSGSVVWVGGALSGLDPDTAFIHFHHYPWLSGIVFVHYFWLVFELTFMF